MERLHLFAADGAALLYSSDLVRAVDALLFSQIHERGERIRMAAVLRRVSRAFCAAVDAVCTRIYEDAGDGDGAVVPTKCSPLRCAAPTNAALWSEVELAASAAGTNALSRYVFVYNAVFDTSESIDAFFASVATHADTLRRCSEKALAFTVYIDKPELVAAAGRGLATCDVKDRLAIFLHHDGPDETMHDTDAAPFAGVRALTVFETGVLCNTAALASIAEVMLYNASGTLTPQVLRELARVPVLRVCDYGAHAALDAAPLGGAHASVHLCYDTISNLHVLAGVASITLEYCESVDDTTIAALAGAHTLCLYGCPNVECVAALARVHTLSLRKCRRVRDVSALGNVDTLNLANTGVADASALARVRRLTLDNCPLSDASMLGGARELSLQGCLGLASARGLGTVDTLHLNDCRNIRDVSMLGGVHTLALTYCSGVTDVAALAAVPVLYMGGCTGVSDTAMLRARQLVRPDWSKNF